LLSSRILCLTASKSFDNASIARWCSSSDEKWKGKEQEWEDFSSAQELRAYIQGYVDCVQALYHMGLLNENKELKIHQKQKIYCLFRKSHIIMKEGRRYMI